MTRIRIISWNVNGVRARWNELVRLAGEFQPDVIALQEIKADRSQVPEPLTGLPDYYSDWHGGPKGYSGVSLHVRRGSPVPPKFSVPPFDFENRVLRVDIEGIVLMTAYVPNGGKDYEAKLQFVDSMIEYAKTLRSGAPAIVCGDLNITRTDMDVHPTQKKARAIGQRTEERKRFEALLEAGGWVDIARTLSPEDDTLFTWWPPWRDEKAKNHGWRIDYFFVPQERAAKVTRCEVLRDFGTSDHAPVCLEIDLN